MDTGFDPERPLSSITLTNQGPPLFHVVMLHGSCGCAENFRKAGKMMLQRFPQSAVTLINGGEKVPENTLRDIYKKNRLNVSNDLPSAFVWYGETCGKNGHKDVANIVRKLGAPPERVVVFGFSQGGFMAADVVHNHPDVSRHAVLHSSALVGSYRRANASISSPACSFDAFLAADDPYLRTPMILLLFRHYKSSALLRKGGHDVSTRYSYGFGHNITEKSMAIATGIIRKRLAADGLRLD